MIKFESKTVGTILTHEDVIYNIKPANCLFCAVSEDDKHYYLQFFIDDNGHANNMLKDKHFCAHLRKLWEQVTLEYDCPNKEKIARFFIRAGIPILIKGLNKSELTQ